MSNTVDPKVFRDLSYGLYIVTSHDGERLNGQIVNTVVQVTSEPPRVAVIVNKQNLTHEFMVKSQVFAACVLDESATMLFLGRFGFRSGRDIDKFDQIHYRLGITGSPIVLDNTLSALEARIIHQIDLGTHTVFVGDVVASEVLQPGSPLTYRYYHEHMKGKTPPKAPSYGSDKG